MKELSLYLTKNLWVNFENEMLSLVCSDNYLYLLLVIETTPFEFLHKTFFYMTCSKNAGLNPKKIYRVSLFHGPRKYTTYMYLNVSREAETLFFFRPKKCCVKWTCFIWLCMSLVGAFVTYRPYQTRGTFIQSFIFQFLFP